MKQPDEDRPTVGRIYENTDGRLFCLVPMRCEVTDTPGLVLVTLSDRCISLTHLATGKGLAVFTDRAAGLRCASAISSVYDWEQERPDLEAPARTAVRAAIEAAGGKPMTVGADG